MLEVTERTLYPEIIAFLKDKLNASVAASEVRIGTGYADIFFKIKDIPFILEIKIGGDNEFIKALGQVFDYAKAYNTSNAIVIVYPESWHGLKLLESSKLTDLVLNTKLRVWIHTDVWTEWLDQKNKEESLIELLTHLNSRINENEVEFDFESVIKAIRASIDTLYQAIRQARTTEIFEEVTEKLELFAGLSGLKGDKKIIEAQVNILSSYLLFNQLLFYQVYTTKNRLAKDWPKLEPISDVNELDNYFKRITHEDYTPIYAIKIIDKLPNTHDVINSINATIKSLRLIKVEKITQEIAGRFFHALLPKEVAKTWAAFYTNVNAADILAGFSINHWDAEVIDPACGSGTLLCAVYRRKLNVYRQLNKNLDSETLDVLHRRFLEQDITGMDIMPFAAHLTTVNLAMQHIEQPTDIVRIARRDSILDSSPTVLRGKFFKEDGILIPEFSEQANATLLGGKVVYKKIETSSPNGGGKPFRLKPVDVVIMNPPFSDRNKLPKDYIKKLKKSALGEICGHEINLWGYFLALADLLLKPGGTIAAVIPINIARGAATQKIREFLIKKYHIKFIIESEAEIAFSESSAFRDVLLIAEKRIPKESDSTKIVFIKKPLHELKDADIHKILDLDNDYVSIKEITHENLEAYKDNLMPLFSSSGLVELFNKIILKSIKLTKFNSNYVDIGLPFRPKGVADGVFITNPTSFARIKNATCIFDYSTKKEIYIKLKENNNLKLKPLLKSELVSALRTNTGIDSIYITSKSADLALAKEDDDYIKLLHHFKKDIPIKFPWGEHIKNNLIRNGSQLFLPRKINLKSDNTYSIGIYSHDKLYIAGPSLWYIKSNVLSNEDLKLLDLYMNSVLGIIQIMLYSSKTQGDYLEIMKSDYSLFKVLDFKKLSQKERNTLLKLFEDISKNKLKPILTQIKERDISRYRLDMQILKIVGLDEHASEQFIKNAYDMIIKELTIMDRD